MTSDHQTIEIQVLRYRPEKDEAPVPQDYSVPFSHDTSVLEGLQYIKDELDPTLSFRWSCRMAICGSCGMMINGEPALACKTFLRNLVPGPVRIEALANFPIERDLVIVMDDFVEKLERIKPYIIEKTPRDLSQGEYLQTPAQLDIYEQFSACINCMLCYAACPQYALNPDFVGPGLIALMHRYNLDSRDAGAGQRKPLANSEAGVYNCTAVGYCSEVCPKLVDPANAVNVNKMEGAKDFFLRLASPGRQTP